RDQRPLLVPRVLGATELVVCQREVEARGCVSGSTTNRFEELGDRLVLAMKIDERHADAKVRLGVVRTEIEDLSIPAERFFAATELAEGPRDAVLHVTIARIERRRALETGERLAPAIDVAVGRTEGEMSVERIGPQRDRYGESVDRFRV